MKRHIGLYSALTVLAAALLLPAVFSCSGSRNAQVRQALAAADSLMLTQPQAALDTLMTIDSTDAGKLPRADKAFYTLLHTEAEYKCYLPVAENTAITEAADYYRRKGPEDRLARALVMQGAVFSERSDPESAMLAYKEAEPLLEHSDDPEQLGLLHTRIGELYQITFSNIETTVYRYRKALECFEAGNCGHRLAAANLALSRILLTENDSADQWKIHYGQGRKYAAASRDTLYILESINQDALFRLIHACDSLDAARLAAGTLRDKGYCSYLSRPLFNSFCRIAVAGYTGSGKTDSALVFADMMAPANIVDSMACYDIHSKIQEADGDFEKALEYERKANELEDAISRESDILNLTTHEHEIQSSYERMRSRHRVSVLVLAAVLLASATAVMTAVHIRTRKSLKRMHRKISVNLQALYGTARRTGSGTEEAKELERMFSALRKQLAGDSRIRSEVADITGRLLAVTNEMLRSYYRYRDGETFRRSIDRLVATHFPHEITPNKIKGIINAVYPGFLDGLRASCPALTDNDILIIALTSCGFDNESMCLLTGVKPKSLMVYKSRIAAKMGLNGKLTAHIRGILASYPTK